MSYVDAHRNYIDLMQNALSHFGSEFSDSFRDFLATEDAIPHTMFFTHIGSPETITIVAEPNKRSRRASIAIEYAKKREAQETQKRMDLSH